MGPVSISPCLHSSFLDSESDDGYPPEAVGVARVAEALQAHTWSHMRMKRDPTSNPAKKIEDIPPEQAATNQDGPSGHVTDKSSGVPGLEKLEEKATAMTSSSKEETQRRVGEGGEE